MTLRFSSLGGILSACFIFVLVELASGQVRVPRLISNGMILQRDVEVKVWGWSSPGEVVSVTMGTESFTTEGDGAGNWSITLPPHAAGGPNEITIRGKNEIIISDVLFGDVWLCSGQSNMELTMDRVKDKYAALLPEAENLFIRQFLVPDQYDFVKAHNDLEGGAWKHLNKENIIQFSAVAFFFARELYEKYHVPIGLINAALGGSPAEAWMSEEAIKNFPLSWAEYKKFQNQNVITEIESSDRNRINQWYTELNRIDPGLRQGSRYQEPEYDDNAWSETSVPGFWADSGHRNINGSMWYRKKIIVPASMAGKSSRLWLGRIVDQDSVFVNGQFVGTTGYQYPPRKYVIQEGLLKKGENVIAVRVINNSGKGGFVPDKPYFLFAGTDTVALDGKWKFREGAVMPSLQGATAVRWKPVGLFNKMISPLLNYRIKGAIWYQGESNADHPQGYDRVFPTMIKDWRTKWNQGDFPFIFVQLANFKETTLQPTQSNWAELRFAQLQTLSLANTGMVVAIDLGEWNDIHPLNKASVGERLALQARSLAYGESNLIASGPHPLKSTFAKDKVTIEFKFADSGLTIRDGKVPKHFAASDDGVNFAWVKARIDGKSIVLSGKNIKNATTIRYAWEDNPEGGLLYNHAGLPATPFEIKR